jgi:hypothetical protein
MKHSPNQVKAFLISTWRSGSTITLKLLESYPTSFAINEPLNMFGWERLSSSKADNYSKNFDIQLKLVEDLFNCNFKTYLSLASKLGFKKSSLKTFKKFKNSKKIIFHLKIKNI